MLARFGALSSGAKAALVVAALIVLGLSVLLSPVVVILAFLALVVALLAVLIRALRRRPTRTWGLIAGASLALLIVFTGISEALYGGGGQEQARSSGGDGRAAVAPAPKREQEEPKPKLAEEQSPQPRPARQKEDEDSGRYDAVATVSRVVDGDTIEIEPAVNGNDEVRLIGVDTPETVDPNEEIEPYGPESSNYATSVLEGEEVEIEFDEERTDQYGRLLAYVYPMGEEMFNAELVGGGYAQAYAVDPNTRYEERFATFQEEARDASLGIWGMSKSDQCELADRGNGIGEGTPECDDGKEPQPEPASDPKPEPQPQPEPAPDPLPTFPDASATASPDPALPSGDLDCSDFDTHTEAQAEYERDTSDPNGLDGPKGEGYTGDQGVACEELLGASEASPSSSASPEASASPGASSPSPGGGGVPSGGGDIDCDQVNGPIPTPPGDPDGLDGDGDGLACE